MNILKYTGLGLLLLGYCLGTSCKKWVAVDPPTNSLVTTGVFNNDQTAITAQFAVYYNLESLMSTLDQTIGLSADEFTNYSTSQYNIDLYRNALNAQTDGGLNGAWSVFYSMIYQENLILENVVVSKGMSDRVKSLMTGEAKFMRAWCYFQLVNMFGNVPLVTSSDYRVSSTIPRTATDTVYAQIVSDLQSSLDLLSPSYLDASDNTGATDRVRPTTWAANALLARVYLYMGKYDLAEQQASLVISNNSMFSLVADLTRVFKMNSAESIWQLEPPTGNLSTHVGSLFIMTAPPPTSNSGLTISQQLLDAFEPNDNRGSMWINGYTQNGITWYYPYKYRDNGKNNSAVSEYTTVLRLAELYLIRAEAKAQLGEAGATDDLNMIRHRAGLSDYSGATDKNSLLSAIWHERRVEFFSEEDRWFDLKRTKTVDGVMEQATPQKGGIWSSYQQLYPLSPNDLQFNPSLVQNTGY